MLSYYGHAGASSEPAVGLSGRVVPFKHQLCISFKGVSLDIENYCTLRLFFDLSTLAGLSRRNLPEAGIRLLFQI